MFYHNFCCFLKNKGQDIPIFEKLFNYRPYGIYRGNVYDTDDEKLRKMPTDD